MNEHDGYGGEVIQERIWAMSTSHEGGLRHQDLELLVGMCCGFRLPGMSNGQQEIEIVSFM